jgi:hypothetical protein
MKISLIVTNFLVCRGSIRPHQNNIAHVHIEVSGGAKQKNIISVGGDTRRTTAVGIY